MVMKYQTIKERSNEVFNGLGGCWVLVDSDYGKNVYQNSLNDDLLYIFNHEYIKCYGNKKFGLLI